MDARLLQLFNRELIHPLADLAAILASTAGLAALLLLPLALTLGDGRRRRTGLVLLGAAALTLGLTLLLQQLVGRARPEEVRLLLATPAAASFPSGHAALAACTAVLLSLSFRRPRIIAGASVSATLIILSRLYLGHHYPSDLVAGALVGAAVGAGSYGLLLAPAHGWIGRLRWLLWPQVALVVLITLLAYMGLVPLAPGFRHGDKLMHFLLFGAVVFWFNLWIDDRRLKLSWLRPPLALLLPFGCAMVEELAQRWAANRTSDPVDLAADLAGMAVFYGLSRLVLRRRRPLSYDGAR